MHLGCMRERDASTAAHATRSVRDLDHALGDGCCGLSGLVHQRLVAQLARVVAFDGDGSARDEEAVEWAKQSIEAEWGPGTVAAYRTMLDRTGITRAEAPLAMVLLTMRRMYNNNTFNVREDALSCALRLLERCAARSGLDAVLARQVRERP